MIPEVPPAEGGFPKRLFLLSLAIAILSTSIASGVLTQLSVDIGTTFFGSDSTLAVAAATQLKTSHNAAEAIFPLLLSVLAIRFRHKPLMLVGLLLAVISSVASFLAPTYFILQISYILGGVASTLVSVMAITLIGDLLPLRQKPTMLSYIMTAVLLGSLFCTALVGYLADIAGWRFTFLYLALPFSIAGLALTSFLVPNRRLEETASQKTSYLGTFKQIFKNKSATACLIASLLTNAGSQIAIFALAFYRIQFAMPRSWLSALLMVAQVLWIVGTLVGGRLVNKFGAKRVTVVATLLAAITLMVFFFIPNLWGILVVDMLHVLFASVASVPFSALVLDQIPKARGSVVSLNKVFNNVGETIAPALGGALLVLTGGAYGAVGLAFGGMTLGGIAVLLWFARDPYREQPQAMKL